MAEVSRRRGGWWWSWRFAMAGLLLLSQIAPARAVLRRRPLHHRRTHARQAVPLYHAALLMDADRGTVLFAVNPDLSWPPASMAKMMLLAVAEDQIRAGRATYNDPVRVSMRAALTGGSRLGLHPGDVYPLGELMKAALIRSANDAAVAVAEKGGGSVDGCVRLMNAKARELGMANTHYETVDGLPPIPAHDVDFTTAHDLAILARHLILTTNLLQWSSMQTAPFDGGRVMLHNTNHLVGHFDGCDGLKTGFTYHAGFNLTATAKRGDMRLISVVLGAPSNPQRFIQSARLLNWGFDNFEKVHLVTRGESLPVHVQVAQGPEIQPIAESDLDLVMPKSAIDRLHLEYKIPTVVQGPLSDGQPIGAVEVLDGSEVLSRVDAICPLSASAPTSASMAGVHEPSSGTTSMPPAAVLPAVAPRLTIDPQEKR